MELCVFLLQEMKLSPAEFLSVNFKSYLEGGFF